VAKFFDVDQSLERSFSEKYAYLWRYLNFFITQHRIGGGKAYKPKKQLEPFSRFDARSLCDTQTDRYNSIYRASIT